MGNRHWATGLGLMAGLLVSGSALAYAELSYETLSGAASPLYDVQVLTGPVSVAGGNFPSCIVNCGYNGGYAWAQGFADASQLQVGVQTTAGSYSNSEGAESKAAAYLTNRFTVNSATLGYGTPVTLQIEVGLSGTFSATSASQVAGMAAMGIIEGATVPRPGGPGEWQQPELISFTAHWRIAETGGYGMYTTVGWQANHVAFYDQNDYGPNGASSYYGLCAAGGPNCFYSYGSAGLDAFGNAVPASYALTVAGLVLDFDVEVGSTYSIFQYLATSYSSADGAATLAESDFSHTLGGTVQTGSNDVTLDWATPLVAVPEPPAAAIWLAGLAMLGIAVRRGRRNVSP